MGLSSNEALWVSKELEQQFRSGRYGMELLDQTGGEFVLLVEHAICIFNYLSL